jgi:transposase
LIYVGIDVHKKTCTATLKQESNSIMQQFTFNNNTEGITTLVNQLDTMGECKAVMESTGNYWIRLHDTLEENGIDAVLANPIKTKAIAKAKLKNDKTDSNILCDLLRADLVYESYVPDRRHRMLRQLVRGRLELVQSRTKHRNRIHAILAKYNHTSPCHELFSQQGLEWLKTLQLTPVDRLLLDANLQILSTLNDQIELVTNQVAKLSVEDPRVKLLMTIPGIDYYTALVIISEIVDVNRFATQWKLVSYAGLCPTQRDSGSKHWRGQITREGSRWLRNAMVEAANSARLHDRRLGEFYQRIAKRRGPQKAQVATAKEMLCIVWHMLRNNEPYRTRNPELVENKYKRLERRASMT